MARLLNERKIMKAQISEEMILKEIEAANGSKGCIGFASAKQIQVGYNSKLLLNVS